MKIWNIGTNINSYIDLFKNNDFYFKDSFFSFFIKKEKKNEILCIKIYDDEIQIKSGSKNTFSQIIRVWLSMEIISLKDKSNFINNIEEFFNVEYVFNIDSKDLNNNYIKSVVIRKINPDFREWVYSNEEEMLNGIALVSLFLYEQRSVGNLIDINDSISTIEKALTIFENTNEYEVKISINNNNSLELNEKFKKFLNSYKISFLNLDYNIILFSYKRIFKENWSDFYVVNEVEKLYNETNFFSIDLSKKINEKINKYEEITTVNVLESKIKSFVQLIKELSNNFINLKPIHIPIYQRNYNWNTSLVNGLLQDILNLKTNTFHYIGNIVIHGNDVYKLIDGQQRLTTCFLILRTIYNVQIFKEYKIDQFLHDFFSLNKGQNKAINIFTRVTSNKDLKSFEKIMKGEKINEIDNVFNVSKFLFEKIQLLNEDELLFLLNNLFLKTLIGVTYDRVSNEYRLFENLNTKSLKLSTMDLVKNFIFMNISHNLVDEMEDSLQDKYQKYISSKFDKIDNSDKTMESFINVFLRSYNMEYDSGSSFSNFKKIVELNFLENKMVETFSEAEKLFEKIGDEIDIYLEISQKDEYFKNNSFLYPYRDILNMLENREIYYPLIIKILKILDFKNIGQQREKIRNIRKILFEIEKYEVRMQVSIYRGQSLSNFIDNISLKINSENLNELELRKLFINKQEDESNNRVSMEKFLFSLQESSISGKISTLICMRIENWLENNMNIFRDQYDFKFDGYEKKTLEHIMPQNIDNWIKDIKLWNNLNSEEEVKKYKSKYLNLIGNHMCIEQISNSKLKNKNFLEKLNDYKKESKIFNSMQFKGFTNEKISLINISNLKKYDSEIIIQRTKEIANIAKIIWGD